MPPISILLAFAAGILTVLSPCVVPILPVVFGAAASRHRLGPVALALGVATAFAGAGLLLATAGAAVGLDGDSLKPVFGGLLIVFGAVLLVPVLQHLAERVLAPLANWGSARTGGVKGDGLAGQFGLGFLLGLVWSPCVGPTLGAASVLASQGSQLGSVAIVMLAFGIGAALPLLGIGMLSRAALAKVRGRLISGGVWGRRAMGAGMLLVGLIVVTGLDRRLETLLLDLSPAALTSLTTSV